MSNRETSARKRDAMVKVERVRHILRRWDPIGVEPGRMGPADEYDSYALTIVSMVAQGCSLDQLCEHLEKIRTQSIGVEKSPSRDRVIASEILNAIQAGSFSVNDLRPHAETDLTAPSRHSADGDSDQGTLEDGVRVPRLETAIWETLSGDSSRRAQAVEELLAGLLADHFGLPARATDGYVPLREEADAASYFSVGKLWMIGDQSSHPVSLQLTFDPSGNLTSGVLRLGLESFRGRKQLSAKDENILLAFPREATLDFEWAYVLEKHSGAWILKRNAE